jgi:hypothetical protein
MPTRPGKRSLQSRKSTVWKYGMAQKVESRACRIEHKIGFTSRSIQRIDEDRPPHLRHIARYNGNPQCGELSIGRFIRPRMEGVSGGRRLFTSSMFSCRRCSCGPDARLNSTGGNCSRWCVPGRRPLPANRRANSNAAIFALRLSDPRTADLSDPPFFLSHATDIAVI